MGVFSTTKNFSIQLTNFESLAKDIEKYFTDQDYEVTDEPLSTGGWHISLSKGGLFKSVLGSKTSLNVEIKPSSNGITAVAQVGIFGQQLIPSVISLFVAWPVMLTQIWGVVKQSKLDDEVMECIAENLVKYDTKSTTQNTSTIFCVECGYKMSTDFTFCPKCGAESKGGN